MDTPSTDQAGGTSKAGNATPSDVVALLRSLDAAVSTNDVEGALSHYAEDVVFLAPEEDAIVGKEAVRAWTEAFFQAYRCEETHHPIQTMVTKELVLNRGIASGSLAPWEGGDPIPFCNKYLHVYRRTQDGGLELLWGAFNTPEPGEKEF